ncbi:hypothetical protein G5I_03183 [Acromyrmex echinatior]|uniref:Uncharacterized protein n=1 Tax=Acromyrmex echinatior TaxID=103372 RepID=F4WCA9_ACREC|nr:hypothetical protein G5I_03183 [Acromyrmex echinatior]
MATTGSAHRAVKCALNSHKAPLAARFVSVGVSCRAVTPKTPSARSCSVINTVDGSCNHRRQSFEPIRTPCFNAVRQESAGRRQHSGGKRATTMKRRRVAKSGDDGSRWGEPVSVSVCKCVQVCVGGDGGRRGLMVCDDGGAGDSGGGGGDGGGEIYTGCQPPNNVIALYKLRERGEQRCSTLKPPSAP